MLEFSYRPQIFLGFYRGEGRSDGSIIEWDRDAGALVLLNFNHRKQQSRGAMKNNMHEE